MDAEFKLNEQEMRSLLSSLNLTSNLIKKSAAALLRKRFKEFVMYARSRHFSGGPSDISGRVGMSVKPGRYGHLADAFSVRLKQAKDPENFGMYAKTMMNKGDHGFIAPMHEFGTGDRYRNRKASVARHGGDWVGRGFGFTGALPARHPFQSAVEAYFMMHNIPEELDTAIGKSIERAMKKQGASL